MKIFTKQVFSSLIVLLLLCSAQVTAAQDAPYVTMQFSEDPGFEYAFLLMGEEGEVSLEWGDGTVEKMPLHPTATKVAGKTLSKDLKISGKISVIECSGNGLLKLDVSNLPTLTDLISRKNFVSELSLLGNPELKMINVQDSPLAGLDLSKCPKVETIVANNNNLSSLILAPNPAVKDIDCTSNYSLRALDLSQSKDLRTLKAMQTMVEEYDLSNCKQLTYLSAGLGRPLKKFILPDENKIDTLMLPMAGLTKLDLSKCKNLKVLITDNNFMLESLDLKGLTELTDLSCESNMITSLDFSDTKKLKMLICNNCMLESLDLTGLDKLESLVCYANILNELKLDGCTSLTSIDCSQNEDLSTLNLPTSLESLDCSYCNFSTLNLKDLTKLEYLYCGDNKLETIDVDKLTGLVTLNCGGNLISSLDLSKHAHLLDVSVSGNPIKTDLSLESATDLRYLSVDETLLEVCALDELYKSLRPKREGDDDNDLGGLLMFNSVPSASVSKTSIATDKGWMLMNVGDGTGCPGSAIESNLANVKFTIVDTPSGWLLKNLPSSVRAINLYGANGAKVSATIVNGGEAQVDAPAPGAYVISPDGMKGIVRIKK